MKMAAIYSIFCVAVLGWFVFATMNGYVFTSFMGMGGRSYQSGYNHK